MSVRYVTTNDSYYNPYNYNWPSYSYNASSTTTWSGIMNFDNNNGNGYWNKKPEPEITQDEFDEIF